MIDLNERDENIAAAHHWLKEAQRRLAEAAARSPEVGITFTHIEIAQQRYRMAFDRYWALKNEPHIEWQSTPFAFPHARVVIQTPQSGDKE